MSKVSRAITHHTHHARRREEALEREGKGAAAGMTPEQIEHRQKERARIEVSGHTEVKI